jgi:Tol biopolymer transport system component
MAPEQAKGRAVDRRADVWAFGAVLYEMLTGQRAFAGDDVSEVLASVLAREPDWTLLPIEKFGALGICVRRCLQRDPKQRFGDMQSVRLALHGAFETPSAPAAPIAAPVASRSRERLAWFLTAALGVVSVAALALAAFFFFGRAPADVRLTRFFVAPPDKWRLVELANGGAQSPLPLAASPDGLKIAFLAQDTDAKPMLWVRALDTLTAQALAGTEGASSPFWSPDSRFLGFFAGEKLKKIDVTGGPPVTLCDAPNNRGGTWSKDGIIVFNPANNVPLQKVSATGGVPTPATVLGPGEAAHRRPYFLPDGRHFLYAATSGASRGMPIYVASLDSSERKLVVNADGNNVAYSRGHLLFVRETTLMAQPFDLGRLTLTGEPVPIAEQLQSSRTTPPNYFFSASEPGVLVYETGNVDLLRILQLTWFDRTGKVLGLVEKPGVYNSVRLSPDGSRVAFSLAGPQGIAIAGGGDTTSDLWVHEFGRNTSTRFTFGPAGNWLAAWSPDGSRVAWSSNRDDGKFNLFLKASNGVGTDEALLKSNENKYSYDWSPDGRVLLYAGGAGNAGALWVLPLAGDDRKPIPYLQQAGVIMGQGRFSPDGRYVAYTSNASGRNEVYVQPFPMATGGKWMVSQGGGAQPTWRRDGKELFYISADSKMMAVPVAITPTFTPGAPKELFAAPIWGGGTTTNVTRYDVTPDGQRFLINVMPQTTGAPPTPMTVVLNWTAALKK